MFRRDNINYNSVYSTVQLTMQIIILVITTIFWMYTLASPVFKKDTYNLKINLLLFSSTVSQAFYIPYFNFSVDQVLFQMVCGIMIFTMFLLTGYCELDFLKIISVISILNNEIVSKLQIVWIFWCILVGHIPSVAYYVTYTVSSSPEAVQMSFNVIASNLDSKILRVNIQRFLCDSRANAGYNCYHNDTLIYSKKVLQRGREYSSV